MLQDNRRANGAAQDFSSVQRFQIGSCSPDREATGEIGEREESAGRETSQVNGWKARSARGCPLHFRRTCHEEGEAHRSEHRENPSLTHFQKGATTLQPDQQDPSSQRVHRARRHLARTVLSCPERGYGRPDKGAPDQPFQARAEPDAKQIPW